MKENGTYISNPVLLITNPLKEEKESELLTWPLKVIILFIYLAIRDENIALLDEVIKLFME